MRTYFDVETVLKKSLRPLTPEELIRRVAGKSERSSWNELKGLRKRGLVIKFEIKTSLYPDQICDSIVFYKWVGNDKNGNEKIDCG